METVPVVLQKKRFDGAMYNAAGSSYQMQWNIAEGYNIAYEKDDQGSIAVAESMNQVYACAPSVDRMLLRCMLPHATPRLGSTPYKNPSHTQPCCFCFLRALDFCTSLPEHCAGCVGDMSSLSSSSMRLGGSTPAALVALTGRLPITAS